MRSQRAFTLIELLVVLVVAAVILLVAAPSFSGFIQMQRLRGVNSQLVTDMQFARSEAVTRNMFMRVSFRADSATTCYTIYTASSNGIRCDCRLGAGAACPTGSVEVRTVQVPVSQAVQMLVPSGMSTAFAFDNVTGALVRIPMDAASTPLDQFLVDVFIDEPRALRTILGPSGRPTVCRLSSSTLSEPLCAG